jgi:hypothetical protein
MKGFEMAGTEVNYRPLRCEYAVPHAPRDGNLLSNVLPFNLNALDEIIIFFLLVSLLST